MIHWDAATSERIALHMENHAAHFPSLAQAKVMYVCWFACIPILNELRFGDRDEGDARIVLQSDAGGQTYFSATGCLEGSRARVNPAPLTNLPRPPNCWSCLLSAHLKPHRTRKLTYFNTATEIPQATTKAFQIRGSPNPSHFALLQPTGTFPWRMFSSTGLSTGARTGSNRRPLDVDDDGFRGFSLRALL